VICIRASKNGATSILPETPQEARGVGGIFLMISTN
jgi:hypothetical protein